ncbi:hypothetical protein FOMA001_g7286 [Fusarium oxysporum f. sp. matthiolae]|nr:hypothetical protein FOMA001_g7286 [Fusarium oxysporum f. sp. matthiolae]
MPSSQRNATAEKKATGPSVPQNPKEHGSKEQGEPVLHDNGTYQI